jgi:hypothetical protein
MEMKPIKIQISDETICAFQNLGQAISNTASAFALHLKPLVKEFQKGIAEFYKMTYQMYLDNGAIYGETQEGYERWMDELCEYTKRHYRSPLQS